MTRSDFLHCLMHLYLFFIISFYFLCPHGGMARDWPRTNSHKNGPESAHFEKIFVKTSPMPIVRTRYFTVYSTTMGAILSTIKKNESSPTGGSPWSTAVWVIMFLAILSLLVGIQPALKALWDRRQSPSNTGNEEERTSSHEQVVRIGLYIKYCAFSYIQVFVRVL